MTDNKERRIMVALENIAKELREMNRMNRIFAGMESTVEKEDKEEND